MEIIQSIITANRCYTAGKKINIKGLMLHSVGCPQPSAEVFVRQFNSQEAKVSVHAFIDGKTGKVYQTLPWEYRAWHCGGSANDTHVGIEMCEPSCLKYTGGATFTCQNREEAMETVKKTYDVAVELFAFLCEEYHLDPLADKVIISHKEGHDKGLASGHGDPDHLWAGLQAGYTMDGFRKDVAAAMKGKGAKAPVAVVPVAEASVAGTPTEKSFADQTAEIVRETAIKEGDVVVLGKDAVYYSGKEIPDWVKNGNWTVKSLSDDRAVLGKNIEGTHEINSPVHVKYLTVVSVHEQADGAFPVQGAVSAKTEVTAKTEAPVKAAVQTPMQNSEFTISDKGVELIAKYEGCKLEAYKCPAGVWTIGYGHTANVKEGDRLSSQTEAKALLKEDLKKYGGYVNDFVKKGIIRFPLTQNQFDALTSFCYNCGNGGLQKLVTDRDAATVAEKILQYNKGGGKVLQGLVKRREEERALFLS